jgi:outer membrane protein assembly factor BamA
MLGYHNLGTIVQTSSRLKDLTAIVSYQNSQRRMNWGAALGRIPYAYYGGYGVEYGIIDGQEVIIEQEDLLWQINYQATAFVAYPFNQVRRVEFYTGFQYIDFDREYITYVYDAYTGEQLYRDKMPLPSADSISFAYTTLALVYDSSLFGATGPIIGQSYILEATPTIGSITYNTIMGDFRKYFMPVRPFTLAFRALHYGRYGKDADDERLWPLYLGYETLVRGYDYNSFSASEFEGNDVFDQARLFGSKILVGNVELRFPLFRVLGIGKGYYGLLPIDMIAFYDWGTAWGMDVFTGEQVKPTILGGERKSISSAGVGLRMNVLGYIVLGINYVKPFDRPNKGWYFQFSFWPGF